MRSQMSIGKKIASVAALLIVFMIVVGIVGLIGMGRMESATASIVGDALPGVYTIGRIESVAKDIRGSMLTHIGSTNQDEMAQMESAIAQSRQQLYQLSKDYEKTITRARDRELYDKISPAFERFMAAWEKPRSLSRESKTQEALAVFRNETLGVFAEFTRALSDESEFNKTSADEFSRDASAAISTARFWSWTVLLIAIACGSALAYFVIRHVSGVLTQSVAELGEGADQVASAASQVSASSQALAQGSSEQAASLEETSASTEEVHSMAAQNTQNSHAAADLVTQSQNKFVETNQSLEQMVVAMGEIKASSDKISKIIKTIDEIAFQTNILALNAAVEAARAGEAGMGFAVVADEVRNLAQRCAQAAKDTAELIEESIVKANDGKVKVDYVAAAIRTITEESGKIKTLVDEVNLGSQEQARGIEQIGKAIVQMEQVTQKTAASAEESAAAAEELTAQSEKVKDVVDRLRKLVGGIAGAHGGSGQHATPRSRGAAAQHDTGFSSGLAMLDAAVSQRKSSALPPVSQAIPLEDDELKHV
jgi:methyl-accepting chemotaxis protein